MLSADATVSNREDAAGNTSAAKALRTSEELVDALRVTNTAPLWAQMTRLNPPAPNPRTIPHVWSYNEIKPYLLRAGQLITEKQAERRVLMLENPGRGTYDATFPNLH